MSQKVEKISYVMYYLENFITANHSSGTRVSPLRVKTNWEWRLRMRIQPGMRIRHATKQPQKNNWLISLQHRLRMTDTNMPFLTSHCQKYCLEAIVWNPVAYEISPDNGRAWYGLGIPFGQYAMCSRALSWEGAIIEYRWIGESRCFVDILPIWDIGEYLLNQ